MSSKRIAAFAVALTMMASVFAFAPAASAYTRVGVRVYAPLPPIRHERVIVRPGPRYVWVPGYWRWERRQLRLGRRRLARPAPSARGLGRAARGLPPPPPLLLRRLLAALGA